MIGTLYLIATPIGNREDITLRAIRTLTSVDVLLCEDTRHTGVFLQYVAELSSKLKELKDSKEVQSSPLHSSKTRDYAGQANFKKPKLISYQEHNELERIPEVVTFLLEGQNVGLVSDAGTPLISDPGFKLVRECIKQGINVVSIPGPSAVISALVSSGLPMDKFTFLGYMPKKEGKRLKLLNEIKVSNKEIVGTVIFYETAERLQATLQDMKELLGDVDVVIARELTKMHEEVWRGKITDAQNYFKMPKGELVLLI